MNNYSQIVAPPKFVAPQDLNLLLKGTMYKQGQAEKHLSEIQNKVDSILSIPAYGKDREKLAEISSQLKDTFDGLDVSNVTDPRSMQQINSIVSEYSNNPDVQAIANRGYSYQNMLNEKKELEKKGKVYVNRGLNQLNKYYSGADYLRDLPFGNDGYQAPDAGEMMENVKKVVTPDEKRIENPDGTFSLVKYYDKDKLKQVFDIVTQSNPNWEKYYRDQLDELLDNVDVNTLAKQTYEPLIQQYNQAYNNAITLASQTSDPALKAKYIQQAQQAQNEVDKTTKILNSPYIGMSFKQDYLNKQKEADIDAMAQALNFSQESEEKLSDVAKMNREHSHDFAMLAAQQAKEIAVAQAKNEMDNGVTSENTQLLLQDLEDAKQSSSINPSNLLGGDFTNNTRVPALFQTKYFEKEVQKEKPTQKYTVDAEGNKTLSESSVTTEKVKEYPVSSTFNNNTWTLRYSDGSTQNYTDEGVKEKLYVANPKYFKELKGQTSSRKYTTPDGREVDVNGYSKEQIDQAIKDGLIK